MNVIGHEHEFVNLEPAFGSILVNHVQQQVA